MACTDLVQRVKSIGALTTNAKAIHRYGQTGSQGSAAAVLIHLSRLVRLSCNACFASVLVTPGGIERQNTLCFCTFYVSMVRLHGMLCLFTCQACYDSSCKLCFAAALVSADMIQAARHALRLQLPQLM